MTLQTIPDHLQWTTRRNAAGYYDIVQSARGYRIVEVSFVTRAEAEEYARTRINETETPREKENG